MQEISLICEIRSLKENGREQRNDLYPGSNRTRTAGGQDAGSPVQHRQPQRLHQALQRAPRHLPQETHCRRRATQTNPRRHPAAMTG